MRRTVLAGAVILVVVAWLGSRWRAAPPRVPGTAPSRDASEPDATDGSPPADTDPVDETDADDPLAPRHHGRGTAWANVDLDAVRAAMPNNMFWQTSSPTTDPEVQRARQEERDRWNVEYGKVLSNTATKEEVDAYYAHRQQMSTDYIQFAAYILQNYGKKLGMRDEGLLKLAIKLHLARLEEIPRQLAEAHQRREAHEAARRAWLDEQKAFEQDAPAADAPTEPEPAAP